MKPLSRTSRLISLVLTLPLLAALASCPDGGAEDAGEAVDEAIDDTKEAVEDAADEVEDAVDEAG